MAAVLHREVVRGQLIIAIEVDVPQAVIIDHVIRVDVDGRLALTPTVWVVVLPPIRTYIMMNDKLIKNAMDWHQVV